MTEWLHFHFSLSCIGEGNGNPLQCPCLENPRDGEAWWAAVYGVSQSWTRLKQLSRQHIKKQRHYFVDKGPSSQGYFFSSNHVWMWEFDCEESPALKNWCFWTVVLERLLRVPWIARRSNQSILKEISPEYTLEGLMLKLKLQYFGHLMRRTDSLERPWCWGRLKAGGEGDDRGWDSWMLSLTQWTWVWVNLGSWWWTGKPGVLQSMGSKRVGHDWATELNWILL